MAKLDQISVNGTTYELVPEVAPLFNTSTAYAVGDYVIKDAVLYRFKATHTSGAWSASQVDEVTAGSELKSIKNDKLDKNQGTANAGKYLKVQSGGQVVPVDLIDNSLLVETMAADSKATGDALNTKLNKNQGTANAGKYLKVGADGNVKTADLDVTTDKTLSIADKAADAKAVGDELAGHTGSITVLNNTVNNLNRQLSDLETRLKSGDEEDAELHLGFYLDENGDLCQVEEDENNG